MKQIHFAILFIFTAIFVVTQPLWASTTVTFNDSAIVNDEVIVLGDIAEITGDQLTVNELQHYIVAPSPALGQESLVAANEVIRKISRQYTIGNINWQGKPAIRVQRKTIRIDQKQLHALFIQFLEQHKKELPQGALNFTSLRTPSEVLLPYGDVTWKITPSRPAIIDSSSFSIFFKVNNKPAANCTIRGNVEAIREVAVATRKIRKGTILSPADLRMEPMNVAELRDPVFSIDQISGMQMKRTLHAGKNIRLKDLQLPPVVREGEPVVIFAGKGNLRITTDGIARSSGVTGDVIRVKNIGSNKLIYARIDAPGHVSVEF